MVKKQLADGSACNKCAQAEELLKRRGLWERIDEVVWAVENDPSSPGLVLAERFGIDVAPFFVVQTDDGSERAYDSVLRLIKELPDGTRDDTASEHPDELARRFEHAEPQEILRYGLERFGSDCAIAFSGAEDVVLIDMAAQDKLPFSVFCLETGRLHPETYRFIERVRQHYGVEIEMAFPDRVRIEELVRQKGLFSFYRDGHGECCGIRKVEPLRRALRAYRAWVTGQRRDQSPATRGTLATLEVDSAHEGKTGGLLKLNPLAAWTSEQVWAYIHEHEVPYNELHTRGFRSIGCEPCTRAVLPGEHERAGRWWWEEATKRECGLHIATNIGTRKG
jgi:phosphoadenosine phosphosulfate reductase